jgi:uncharacterized protein YceK
MFFFLVIFGSGCGATFTFGSATEKPPIVYMPAPQNGYYNDGYNSQTITPDMY